MKGKALSQNLKHNKNIVEGFTEKTSTFQPPRYLIKYQAPIFEKPIFSYLFFFLSHLYVGALLSVDEWFKRDDRILLFLLLQNIRTKQNWKCFFFFVSTGSR